MEPLFGWKGCQDSIVPDLLSFLPQKFGVYYEPFFGGGSLFLALSPSLAVVGDINKPLMYVYKCVQKNAGLLVAWLCKYQHFYNNLLEMDDKEKEYMLCCENYAKRLKNTEWNIEDAALFIYLNKLSVSHEYHVNEFGVFDVPFGGEDTVELFDVENLYAIEKVFQNVLLCCGDYEHIVKNVKKGDFIFFDPPELGTKKSLLYDTFLLDDHKRLLKFFTKMDKKGVYCMLTIRDSDIVQNLYRDYCVNKIRNERNDEYLVIRNYE